MTLLAQFLVAVVHCTCGPFGLILCAKCDTPLDSLKSYGLHVALPAQAALTAYISVQDFFEPFVRAVMHQVRRGGGAEVGVSLCSLVLLMLPIAIVVTRI